MWKVGDVARVINLPINEQTISRDPPFEMRPSSEGYRTPHHVIWWDAEEDSESDVRLRVERMIAQGKAHPYDRFFYVSWRR